MSLNCGIVGLPNVGKSTLFSALTAQRVPMENYPFCTIEPNRGIVEVPDERLKLLSGVIKPEKTIPAVVEFVDIAGLVAGASKGEGLGNRFLAHIREVGLIVHVVRCFHDEDVAHVAGAVDPISDVEVVNIELALADLETVENRIEKNVRQLRSDNRETASKAKALAPLLDVLKAHLSEGKPARGIDFDEKSLVDELHLITMKPVLFVGNIDEEGAASGNDFSRRIEELAGREGAGFLTLCCELECEIAALDSRNEQKEFLEAAGLPESGLDRLIRISYEQLGLRTFFTENGKEVRAWTFEHGEKAPKAAGRIHTDFEAGFIKAEVYNMQDLVEFEDVHKIREAGKLRIEGKEYEVEDGDVILFRFNG